MRSTTLGTLATGAAMGVLLALVLLMGSGTAHASFSPTTSTCLTQTIPQGAAPAPCDGTHTAGANDSLHSRLGIGLGPNEFPNAGLEDDVPDVNFGPGFGFTPPRNGASPRAATSRMAPSSGGWTPSPPWASSVTPASRP